MDNSTDLVARLLAFAGFPDSNIDLSWENLKEIPAEIAKLAPVLQRLFVDNNELTIFPPAVCELTAIQYLNCSSNKIEIIPAEIQNLTRLTTLDLARNKIAIIPPEIGSLPVLEELNLQHNVIWKVPSELGNASRLRRLQLFGNRITDIPASIGKLTRLENLNLGANPITSLPMELRALQELLPWGGLVVPLQCGGGRFRSTSGSVLRYTSFPRSLTQICCQRIKALRRARKHNKAREPDIQVLPIELQELLKQGGLVCFGCGHKFFGPPGVAGEVVDEVGGISVWLQVRYCDSNCVEYEVARNSILPPKATNEEIARLKKARQKHRLTAA